MTTVLLIIHLMIAAGLVAVVLLQRSEGGALGIGGGGGGGFLTGRGTANFLTRVTAGLAAAFFVTSIALTLLANHTDKPRSIFDAPVQKGMPAAPKTETPTDSGALPKLNPIDQTPKAPKSQ